jgi:hypothetical protein
LVQVPGALKSAHDWQGPEQAALQQFPCAQKVLRHSEPLAQAAPLLFSPQEPRIQTLGGVHC